MSLITDNGNRYHMPDIICTMPINTKIMPNGTYRHISAACLWHLLHEHIFIESVRYALFSTRNRWQVNWAWRTFLDNLMQYALFLCRSPFSRPTKIRYDLPTRYGWVDTSIDPHSIYDSAFQRSNWILYVSFGMPHHQKNDRVDFVTEIDGCFYFIFFLTYFHFTRRSVVRLRMKEDKQFSLINNKNNLFLRCTHRL